MVYISITYNGSSVHVALYDHNLVEAHCYGIGRTGQIVEQSRSSEKSDRNVDVSTAKVFVSYKTFVVETSTFLSVFSLLRDCSTICPVLI